MICLGDRPTEGRHKIRQKAIKKKKKKHKQKKRAATQTSKNKKVFLCPASGARTTQETRGKAEIEGAKNNNNNHKDRNERH